MQTHAALMADRFSGSYASLSDADHAACSRYVALHCRYKFYVWPWFFRLTLFAVPAGVLIEDAPHEGGVEDTMSFSPIVLLLTWVCTYALVHVNIFPRPSFDHSQVNI